LAATVFDQVLANIGVQVEWISTFLNFIANDISRPKKESAKGDFGYGRLKETYPILDPCRRFQQQTKSCPDPLIPRELRPSTLEQFTS
jgi:hypothetical protein